jgi:hypothetical protein
MDMLTSCTSITSLRNVTKDVLHLKGVPDVMDVLASRTSITSLRNVTKDVLHLKGVPDVMDVQTSLLTSLRDVTDVTHFFKVLGMLYTHYTFSKC